MNYEEFKAAVARNEEMLRQGIAPPGTDACSSCGKPIQTFLTGREYLGDGSVVCSECYFDELGREVEAHPIGVGRGRFGRRTAEAHAEDQPSDTRS